MLVASLSGRVLCERIDIDQSFHLTFSFPDVLNSDLERSDQY